MRIFANLRHGQSVQQDSSRPMLTVYVGAGLLFYWEKMPRSYVMKQREKI